MKRHMRLFSALALVGMGLTMSAGAPPARAAAPDPAYCGGTSVNGFVTYSTTVTPVPSPNTFVMTLSCVAIGPGHNAGAYSLTLYGTTPLDSCAGSAPGSAGMQGTAPEGSVGGWATFTRSGAGYSVHAEYVAGGATHVMYLFLTLVNPSPGPCGYNSANIIGQGGFADHLALGPITAPDNAEFAVSGSGTFSPGLDVPFDSDDISFSGSATGLFNGATGSCTMSLNAHSDSANLAGELGSGFLSCFASTPPIIFSCSYSYQRVLWDLALQGLCTGSTTTPIKMQLRIVPGQVVPPVTTFTATGSGVMG